MAGEHHPHSRTARSGQGHATAPDNTLSTGDLTANADLHVIYEEGGGLAVAQICQLDGDGQIVCMLHDQVLRAVMEFSRASSDRMVRLRRPSGQTGTRAVAGNRARYIAIR